MKDDQGRVQDILEAIERIEKYAIKGKSFFLKDELIQNWMIRNLQIIGEASRSLSAKFRDEHVEIPWKEIIGMRHILVHDYFDIDLEAVWLAIENDLRPLKNSIKKLTQIPAPQ